MKTYLVELVQHYSPEVWWKTITEIRKYTSKIEIVCAKLMPILAITIKEGDLKHIEHLKGVRNVEDDEVFETFDV